jgi:hypothetical protein
MKGTVRSISLMALTGGLMFMTTGCATIFNKTSVVLYGYTDGMKVSENGKPIQVEQTYVGQSGMAGYSSGVTYYGAGFKVKRQRADHKILLEKDGKTKEVILKSKFATGTLIADLFTSGPLGILIDIVAGPLRTISKKYIDSQYEFGVAEQKSKHKLKKEFKKSFK